VLQQNGYQVSRLVRGTPSGPNQIAWTPGESIASESLSGFDAVVHLAGESIVGRWTDAKKHRIRESRIPATQTLAESLARAPQPPKVFVSASAIGYYGNRGEEVLREDSAPGKGFLAEACIAWEAATMPAARAGIRTAQIRIGVVLSPKGGALGAMLAPFRLGLGGNMGNGRQWWSWVDVQDVAGIILHVLKTENLQGPVNAVSPNPVTNAEFTRTLASVLSRPAIFPMPSFAAHFILGEMADELLLASQHVLPAKLIASGYQFRRPDLRQSLEFSTGKRP
jgi:uncharacterized protein (TIGR01777 family)